MAKRYVKKKKKRRARFLRVVVLVLLAVLLLVILLVGRSACKREPVADALWDGGWYRDDLGRIEDEKALVRGMEAFEKRIGVKPYLTILDGVDPEELDIFAQDQYDALFTDGSHLLVVYDEWAEDGYYLAAWAGETSTLSQEDITKLLACLENAYADPANKTYAEAFGTGFRQGARELPAVAAGSGVGLLLVLGLLLILLSAVLVFSLRKRAREAARREALYLEEEG